MFLLRDDVEVDVGSFGHEFLDGEVVKVAAQAVGGGAAHDGLGDAIFAHEGGRGAGGICAGKGYDLGA